MQKRIVANAVISELKKTNACLYVKGVLFNLKTNLNGVRVTEAFMDEIVENKEKYLGIPLCADVKGLISGKAIGHMYDAKKDEFKSQIIGSMIDFEKVDSEDGPQCVITYKVMKRYRAVCEALGSLFASGDLKFSFELLAGEYTEEEDGTIVIDASESNYLEGAAVVTFPACEEAVAMQLVAECLNQGDENMENENKVVAEVEEEEVKTEVAEAEEVTAETEEVVAETEEAAVEEVVAETETTETAEAEKDPKEEEPEEDKEEEKKEEAECKDEKKETAESQENAEVLTRTTHTEIDEEHAYDTETGDEIHHEVVETTTLYTTAEADIKKLTESVEQLIAELAAVKQEIAEMKAEPEEPLHTVAEAAHVEYDLLNPFVENITSPKKYTLLESEKSERQYSLLDPVD